MDILQAIQQRRAVRAYTGEALDRECIARLVAAAVRAPSAHNAQPWAFSATIDRPLLKHIAHETRDHLLRHLPPDSPLPRLMPSLLDEQCDIFYGAPALVVISATSDEPWAREACGMAAQNLMLAACAEGLGSCCIGLAVPWFDLPESKALLGIARTHRPLLPIVLGHAAAAAAPSSRRAADIHWMEDRLVALE
ncbi:nitroreductase family protein [Solimonas soli]|uniref:nitroreductase family protein n=1 Tax=Solimonas soli TaxID=413479 RepID=UPI000484B3AB|nr:nitroreductase family protein [Solimonas soli]